VAAGEPFAAAKAAMARSSAARRGREPGRAIIELMSSSLEE
jgi:hypothetical protein